VSKADLVRNLALSLVGQKYHWGEEPWYVIGPEATKVKLDTDCSGLPYGVFRKAGVKVDGGAPGRLTAHGLYIRAKRIRQPARVGDLGFLLRNGRAYHTFLYVGYDEVVEAGDGTGHVGLRTVAYENARGAIWGRLNTDIGELEEAELNVKENRWLREIKLSTVVDSFDRAIAKAERHGDVAGAATLEAQKIEEVEAKRIELGLTVAQAVALSPGGGAES